MIHEKLTETIIGCAIKVHNTLGPGFLESVYQKALEHELKKAGLSVVCEYPLNVHYDTIIAGEFSADMLVENTVIIENKAAQALVPKNEVQLVNYLNATRKDIGLLLNFGAESLQFKRKHRCFNTSHSQSSTDAEPHPLNPVNPVRK
jgi:GxxExxY protein